jgi:hypothetical protein
MLLFTPFSQKITEFFNRAVFADNRVRMTHKRAKRGGGLPAILGIPPKSLSFFRKTYLIFMKKVTYTCLQSVQVLPFTIAAGKSLLPALFFGPGLPLKICRPGPKKIYASRQRGQ